MSIPNHIREEVTAIIWKSADSLNWTNLNIHQRTQQYKIWAQDECVGGVLSRYMPIERVHPYIKDSILKPYAKNQKLKITDISRILKLQIDENDISEHYIKPHGIRTNDNKIICWGRAVDWKIVLMATYERSTEDTRYISYAAVLSQASGKFNSGKFKKLIEDARSRLGILNIYII